MSTSSITASAIDAVEFDAAIISKLSQSGPRYTSYPTADRFVPDFGYGQFLEAVAGLRLRRSQRPLSLYIHCLLYTSPSPRDGLLSRMPSSA